jgi:hypothetical protein
MKCIHYLLLLAASLSAVSATPSGGPEKRRNNDGWQERQDVRHQDTIFARAEDLQPRLAFMTLIPGLGGMKFLKNLRHHRRDLEDIYEARDLTGRGEIAAA